MLQGQKLKIRTKKQAKKGVRHETNGTAKVYETNGYGK